MPELSKISVQCIDTAHILCYNKYQTATKGADLVNTETINLSIRMERDLKEQAERLFAELGMNMTTALNIFVRQSVRQGKIPFEISLNRPNAETMAALREIADMRSGKIPKQSLSVAEFVKEMDE
jgi:DNA-damage-inducible protein J